MVFTLLQRYLRVQRSHEVDLDELLRDAAREAERRILAISNRRGVGGEIRRAQYRLVLREIHALQREMWGGVGKQLNADMSRAARAAADAENAINRLLFQATGTTYSRDFAEAMRIQAEQGLKNVAARGANGVPLSKQVYRTRAWSNNLLDRTINRGILLGLSAKEIAASVKELILPSTPGGVSYAAKRLGRTELNNAFHTTQIDLRKGDPWVEGLKWNLSSSHPRPDVCDQYAHSSHYRGGDSGVFRKGDVPSKPHPQCLCFLTTVTVPPSEFEAAMVAGRYDSFINSKLELLEP